MGSARCGVAAQATFAIALATGTSNSILSKVLLSCKSIGITGEEENFAKPLFQTGFMFAGMIIALLVHCVYERIITKPRRRGYESIEGKLTSHQIDFKQLALLAVPATFDLAATALSMMGLVFVEVSVSQMLRGAAIVFVAFLKHFVLKTRLEPYMWIGVALNALSILLVSLKSVVNSEPTSENTAGQDKHNSPLVGIALILSGSFVRSLQYVFEEAVMTSDVGIPPLLVIGMEGFFGILICVCLLYPIAASLPGSDHGKIEDPVNTWTLVQNSEVIQIICCLYFISVAIYNIMSVLITYLLNSVWHAILDNFRPVIVWMVDLFIYYFVSKNYGERWTEASWLQVFGLFTLLYGTAVYNGSLKLPGFRYAEEERPEEGPGGMVVRTPRALASPSLGKSPLISRQTARRQAELDGPSVSLTMTDNRAFNEI